MTAKHAPSPSPNQTPACWGLVTSKFAGSGQARSRPGEGASRLRREAGEGSLAKSPAPATGPSIATSRARELRSRMTDAERKLWFALRDRRFANFKFRRQVPVGPFIADFVCYTARVVVEVDGGQHADSSTDERRDRWFPANPFLLLRFGTTTCCRILKEC